MRSGVKIQKQTAFHFSNIMETKVNSAMFQLNYLKGTLFCKFPCLRRKNLKIAFIQKMLVKEFRSWAHFDPWVSQRLWVIVI